VKQFYDPLNNRLVYIESNANSHFWESHWDKYDLEQMIKSALLNRMVLVPSRRYLHKGARILEGGCGLGQNVWSLHKNGYDVYGVDYAASTVKKVNNAIPELKVSCGDVRSLRFDNNFFDGYWSLGVIEHFYEGYDTILNEAKRVLKPGGFLFLTFPCMSKFRAKKAAQGKYLLWDEPQELPGNFYQFALSAENVESTFRSKGFKLVKRKYTSGLKGFKDEIGHHQLKKLLQQIYDSKSFPGMVLAWVLDKILSKFAGHTRLLIFKNLK